MVYNCTPGTVPPLNASYQCINATSTPVSQVAATALNDKQKVRIAIYILSIILSWTGNSLVIIVSAMNRRSLSPCRILMTHLAVANLLFSIRLPFQIRLELNGYVWEWGRFYCKVMHGFNSASLLASIETVIVIAIERYRGISKPYSQKWTKRHIIFSILIVWGISLITYSPYMYFLDINGIYCSDRYPSLSIQQAYSVTIFIIRYVVPLIILSYCYFKVGMVIRRRSTRVSTHQSQATELHRKKENTRIIRILVVIVVAFAVLTAPTSIWWLWYDFGGTGTAFALDIIEVFAALLYLHSAINPIIYGVMDQKFKQGVRNLLAYCIRSLRAESSIGYAGTRSEAPPRRTVTFDSKV